jgi:hypothetical protein
MALAALREESEMRTLVLATLIAIVSFSVTAQAGNFVVVPTTTLNAETSNNTSAATTFTSQTNGNLGASNISKVDIHTLLYPGSNTKVIAHFMPWFGQKNHMNVGYNSQDPAQVHSQITDMISRGIDGVIIDWYGSADYSDGTAKLVMAEAEQHPGFTFAIMVDKGALKLSPCPGCTPQQTLIQQVQYIEQTYIPSPAYMRINNRPMITNFDIDLHYTIDWDAVQKATSTNPDFIFQHASGFTHDDSGGSYAWISYTAGNFGLPYLDKFYKASLAAPKEETFGGSYKGFNDTLASWGSNRIMGQQCGQTWLQTFSELNGYYDSGTPLANVQLVTWNDYEEGTEIESGIDNCVSVSASLSGSSFQWSITGSESTIDHYVVYISTDGQNLMPLNTMPVGSRSLDLSSYSLGTASYTLFVQAVGKPTIKNQMSGAIGYNQQNNQQNTVTVSAPAGGLTGQSPVHYIASASTSCSKGVSAIGIYTAPSQLAYVINGSVLDTNLTLNPGSYNTVVQSWDNCGGSTSTAVPITITTAQQGTVTVTAPAKNGNVGSPVHFTATATTSCSKGISAMGIYTAPYVLAYSVKGAKLDTSLTLSAGNYNAVVQEWDNCGGAATTPVALTVNATNNGSVSVTAPSANGNVGSPVHFTATATSTCSKGISAMGIYTAPSQLAYVVSGAKLDTNLTLSSGSYNTVVQEWDNCGGSSTTSVPITVTTSGQSSVTITSPNQNSNVGSPVHFVAAATSSCSKGVGTMGIYTAPSQLAYVVSGSKLDTHLTLSPGTYDIVIHEWDNCGGGTSTPITTTIASGKK